MEASDGGDARECALRVPNQELPLAPENLPREYLLEPQPWFSRIVCPARYRVRKNQKSLTATDWARFIIAIESLSAPGVRRRRPGTTSSRHRQAMNTMWDAHGNVNFLTWHGECLAKVEAALVAMNPS